MLAAESLLMVPLEPVDASLSESSLEGLVARAQAGDRDAFDALVSATQRRVSRVALQLLGTREDALDATQEVYLRVYRFLGRYRRGEDFHAWLYRIAVNACRDLARKRRRSPFLQLSPTGEGGSARPEPAATVDIEAEALESERRDVLLRALATLPYKERQVLVLRDLGGSTTEEVARLLGSSAVTVRSQACKARVKVRRFFEKLLGPASRSAKPPEVSE